VSLDESFAPPPKKVMVPFFYLFKAISEICRALDVKTGIRTLITSKTNCIPSLLWEALTRRILRLFHKHDNTELKGRRKSFHAVGSRALYSCSALLIWHHHSFVVSSFIIKWISEDLYHSICIFEFQAVEICLESHSYGSALINIYATRESMTNRMLVVDSRTLVV
jgi:hypothetical protein